MRRRWTLALAALAVALTGLVSTSSGALESTAAAPASRVRQIWRLLTQPITSGKGMRGITVGPIESSLQPGRGYGSSACHETMNELTRLGANWVSITPFGRIWDLAPSGVDMSFEAPFHENAKRVAAAIDQAHARGLKVLLVPHLWAETGVWRGEIDPPREQWQDWTRGYRRFILRWAELAEAKRVEMFPLGVELRSWATTTHAPSLSALIRELRRKYSGLLTYAANWDDAELTVIWGSLDVIGINAFFPLASAQGATLEQLRQKAREVSGRLGGLARRWSKPVLFTEMGYTTRPDPALRPWEWPEDLPGAPVDQAAQAMAYQALLGGFIDEPWFVGFFVWRYYADPHDMSQEPEWGFSPRGKLAELVLRDAFNTHWAVDGARYPGTSLRSVAATTPGAY